MESRKCENTECENIVTELNCKGKLKMHCSAVCRSRHNSAKSRDKARETWLKNNGDENPLQSEKIKNQRKQTNLERRGVENPMKLVEIREKARQTCLERHGVENPMKCPVIKETFKRIMLERHGAENPMQCQQFKNNLKNTIKVIYGVENVFQSPEIKEQIKRTHLNNYGVEHPSKSDTIKEKKKKTNITNYGSVTWGNKHISVEMQALLGDFTWLKEQNRNKTLAQMAIECGISGTTVALRFKKYNISVKHHAKSFFEKQVYEYVKLLHHTAINNDRTQIKPYELDIYLPDLNIAFECNGEPWHKDPLKEENKFNMCKNINIDLYFIWYKDWKKDQENIKNFIKNQIEIRLTNHK